MTKIKIGRFVANFFGGIGYLLVAVQWVWMVVTVLSPLMTIDSVQKFTMPANPNEVDARPVFDITIPTYMETVIVWVSVIFALAIVTYAIFAIPKSVARAGHKITKASAEFTINTTQKNQPKMNQKRRFRLTARYVWYAKLIAAIIPAALLLIPPSDTLGLSHELVAISGIFLAVSSLVSFLLQYAIASISQVNPKHLV